MDSGTQGKPGEHSCLIQLHMEQDGSMPIKVTTAWLCALHTESVLLLMGFLPYRGKKKKSMNFGSKVRIAAILYMSPKKTQNTEK